MSAAVGQRATCVTNRTGNKRVVPMGHFPDLWNRTLTPVRQSGAKVVYFTVARAFLALINLVVSNDAVYILVLI